MQTIVKMFPDSSWSSLANDVLQFGELAQMNFDFCSIIQFSYANDILLGYDRHYDARIAISTLRCLQKNGLPAMEPCVGVIN